MYGFDDNYLDHEFIVDYMWMEGRDYKCKKCNVIIYYHEHNGFPKLVIDNCVVDGKFKLSCDEVIIKGIIE
jgi:hypothetical protein